MAERQLEGFLGERSMNPIVFLDIQIGERLAGRITIELRADLCPKTAENFRVLCTGEYGLSKDGFTAMHYKGCVFHRVVTAYLCQSGDIKCGNGTWSPSIFSHNNPGAKFADENVILRHAGPGVLSMVNEGPDSNGSGFYIDFVENERLNDKNVVFGVVCSEDSIAVLFEMERQGSLSGKPRETIMIADCGQLYP